MSRFDPKATKMLRCREVTCCAINGHKPVARQAVRQFDLRFLEDAS
jgi:hypothetical protein